MLDYVCVINFCTIIIIIICCYYYSRPLSIVEMFLASVILFYIVLLYVLGMLGCVYVWTVVSAGYPALLFQLIVLCLCVWFVLVFRRAKYINNNNQQQ